MGLRQKLSDLIPEAYYSDGTESKCSIFKICNMFDVDPQSYKIVKESNIMEKKKEGVETKVSFGKLNHFISDEISKPEWGSEFNTKTGKLV